MKPKSTDGIGRIAAAALRSYASVDRMTRPLIADPLKRRWPSRDSGNELRPEHCSNLIPAFAAPSLDKIVAWVEMTERMMSKVDYPCEYDFLPPAPEKFRGCRSTDSLFPWLTSDKTPHNWLTGAIADLMAQQPAVREARAARLDAAGWTLAFSHTEQWMSVSWAGIPDDAPDDAQALQMMMYWKIEPQETLSANDWRARGIRQVVQIPIAVLLAAAEACDASYLARAKRNHERFSEPERGGTGKGRATSPKRKKLEAGELAPSPAPDDRKPTKLRVSALNKRNLRERGVKNQLSLATWAEACQMA